VPKISLSFKEGMKMPDKKNVRFSEVATQMITEARQAEEYLKKGQILKAKAQLSKTMINLVNLYGILNDD